MAKLFEVCTGADSPLMQAGREEGVRVEEFGLHNGYNMLRTSNKQKIARRARRNGKRTRAMLMSPPCDPYSPLQNLTKRKKTKHRAFLKRRHGLQPVYTNCYELGTELLRKGIELIVEQPKRCRSWKRTALRDQEKVLKYSRTVLGCAVGLRAPDDKRRLMSKQWLFKTSSLHIAKALDGLDVCRHACKHVSCIGKKRTDHSKHYTPVLARKIIHAVNTLPVPQSTTRRRKRKTGRPRINKKAMSSTQRWRKFAGKDICQKGKAGRPCLGPRPMTPNERNAKRRGKAVDFSVSKCYRAQ